MRHNPCGRDKLLHILSIFQKFKIHASILSPPIFHWKLQSQKPKLKNQELVNNKNFWKIQSCSGRLEALWCSDQFQNFGWSGGHEHHKTLRFFRSKTHLKVSGWARQACQTPEQVPYGISEAQGTTIWKPQNLKSSSVPCILIFPQLFGNRKV